MRIIYMDCKDNKIVALRVTISDTMNKVKIPKSIITLEGIIDGNNKGIDNPLYVDTLEYISKPFNNTRTELREFMDATTVDDIVYVVDMASKELVAKAGIHTEYTQIKKFVGDNTTYVIDMITIASKLSADTYTIWDLLEYDNSKATVNILVDTPHLFLYKEMEKGIYFSYQNKEAKATSRAPTVDESMDIHKTKIALGKRVSTNVYRVYDIPEEPILDKLYENFRLYTKISYYTILLLNNVVSSRSQYHLMNNQLVESSRPLRLESPTGDILISEINPAGVSYYAFQTFNILRGILSDFKSDTPTIANTCSLDVTDLIYDDKGILHIGNFDIVSKYIFNDQIYNITLSSSLDLPSRSKLKAIEKQSPKVHLIIMNENGVMCRYYTVVTSKLGDVLTGNYPANMVLLSSNK